MRGFECLESAINDKKVIRLFVFFFHIIVCLFVISLKEIKEAETTYLFPSGHDQSREGSVNNFGTRFSNSVKQLFKCIINEKPSKEKNK